MIAGIVAFLFWGNAVWGGSWPTYRHDNARSGITAESLSFPLDCHWVFQPLSPPEPAWGDPKPEPVEGYLELRRMHFDDVFHVVADGGLAYFGSSADGKLYALDVESGELRWTAFTQGPIRLAPTVAAGRVYVGSDDGWVYCFAAKTGEKIWSFRAAPEDRRVLGSGKLISVWPVRTGVLVDGDLAYFGAGVFPSEGVFLFAADAKTGEVRWQNDSCGEEPQSRISFQGYLLASPSTLYAPIGRVSPAAFDRVTGRLKSITYFGKEVGGTYALLVGDEVYTGTETMVAYHGQTRDRFAIFNGRQLVVTPKVAYVADGTNLAALDRERFPPVSTKVASLRARKADLQAQLRRQRTAEKEDQLRGVNEQLLQAEREFEATVFWKIPCSTAEAMILAGGALVLGGTGQVQAVRAEDGQVLWQAKVEGIAKGLAVADRRLLVSTTTGAIYCFGLERVQQPRIVRQADLVSHPLAAGKENSEPSAGSSVPRSAAQIAAQLLKETGTDRGYALVAGLVSGELARELARQSRMTIYAVDSDHEKVERIRRQVDAEGLTRRIWVQSWPLDKLPYADYFANLIVSEQSLLIGRWPVEPASLNRMLKPCGGVLVLGRDVHAGGSSSATGWILERRGELAGAGNWTHQYAESGNTACSGDQLVGGTLRVLWFGLPGPGQMVNRHARAASPLCYRGQLFVQGENVLMAYDAYNGVKLWEKTLPGAMRVDVSRQTSNLAVGEAGLFVAVGNECLRFDRATGELVSRFSVPLAPDGTTGRWGYLAYVDDLLVGTRTTDSLRAGAIFAYEVSTGKLRWVYEDILAAQSSISIGDGRLYLVCGKINDSERLAAIDPEGRSQASLTEETQLQALARQQTSADIRAAVCLDLASGKPLWRQPVDVTLCGGGRSAYNNSVCTLYRDGVLLIFGVFLDGHYWQEFFAGQFAQRHVLALNAVDGSYLWGRAIGYRVRPLVVGDTLHAEPWAFDLRTGQPRTRINPTTGRSEIWQFARPGHHCGCPAASSQALFFRSYCLGFYDLHRDEGTMHFGGQRPGCWINFLPAAGLLLMPEASAGCMCPFPNMCTVVLQPVNEPHGFSYFSCSGPLKPVRRLGLNLGAPGDRLDAEGNLWLGIPRPGGPLIASLECRADFLSGGGFRQRNSSYTPIRGTPNPWLFASWAEGLRRLQIPLLDPDHGRASYAVRLGFLCPPGELPGHRVCDILLQGKGVREKFDPAAAAPSSADLVWLNFEGIAVDEVLTIELRPVIADATPERLPRLAAIELIRQEVLSLGCSVPNLTLSAVQPRTEAQMRLGNLREEEFKGRVVLSAPPGIEAEPTESRIALASGETKSIPFAVEVRGTLPAGQYPLRARIVADSGRQEAEREATIEYLGNRRRVVLDAEADASVSQSAFTQNNAKERIFLVDGGDLTLGDHHHQVAYLRFRWKQEGKIISAKLELHNAGNPTGNSGLVRLVDGPWEETTVTYQTRPPLGEVVGRIGAVAEQQMVSCPLSLELPQQGQLDLAIDPTSCDGVNYFSRESEYPPRLILEILSD